MTLLNRGALCCGLLGTLFLSACSGSDSEPSETGDGHGDQSTGDGDGDSNVEFQGIPTSAMWANFEVVAGADGTTEVFAELRVGGARGTFIDLDGEDQLVVSSSDDEDVVMSPTASKQTYQADLSSADEGLLVGIAFVRGEGIEGAPSSSVSLPAPFSLSSPDLEELGEWGRGQDLAIAWTNPSPTQINWELQGECIDTEDGQTDDDGDFTIAADLIVASLPNDDESCVVTVTFSRVTSGELDPAFGEGGAIQAIQRRTFQFTSTAVVP